jgi:phage-related protein
MSAQQTITPNVQQIKFGDGYEARLALGLNTKLARWDVSFTKTAQDAVTILNFLKARGAVEAFAWTDPLNRAGVYVCREWSSLQESFGIYTIRGVFEEIVE